MTIGKTELQVLWGAANNFTLATGNSWVQDSDAMTEATACVRANIQLKADQTVGTPAAGDYVDFYVLPTLGDPDGVSTDEYDTPGHAHHLVRLNLATEEPAKRTINFPVGLKGFKIRAVGAGFATTDTCDVSATVMQTTA